MPGPFDAFQVGQADRYGEKISHIVGRTSRIMVYMVDDDDIAIDCTADQQTPREIEIINVFNRLESVISTSIPKRKSFSLRYDLAGALYCALCDDHSHRAVNEFFAAVSEHVTTRALDTARFVYVTSGFAGAVIGS